MDTHYVLGADSNPNAMPQCDACYAHDAIAVQLDQYDVGSVLPEQRSSALGVYWPAVRWQEHKMDVSANA